jgi:hypothetical protein
MNLFFKHCPSKTDHISLQLITNLNRLDHDAKARSLRRNVALTSHLSYRRGEDREIQTSNTGIVTCGRCVAEPSPPLDRKRGACASAASGHDAEKTPDQSYRELFVVTTAPRAASHPLLRSHVLFSNEHLYSHRTAAKDREMHRWGADVGWVPSKRGPIARFGCTCRAIGRLS